MERLIGPEVTFGHAPSGSARRLLASEVLHLSWSRKTSEETCINLSENLTVFEIFRMKIYVVRVPELDIQLNIIFRCDDKKSS